MHEQALESATEGVEGGQRARSRGRRRRRKREREEGEERREKDPLTFGFIPFIIILTIILIT